MKPIEVKREAVVAAPAEELWWMTVDPERLALWFTFAERIEPLEGEGLGRRQRLHGRWGKKRSEVDQVVVEFESPRLFAWEHEAERLNGKPAPRFASKTRFSIEFHPVEGGTLVRMHSYQVPAGTVKALVMKMFGTRDVARNMEQSLEQLKRSAED